jgi:hypothetical protein
MTLLQEKSKGFAWWQIFQTVVDHQLFKRGGGRQTVP